MQPETVYNPTTISSRGEWAGYLDSISQGSRRHRRCCTTAIAVLAVICTLLGPALVLYGSVFHHHYSGPPPPSESPSDRDRRLSDLLLYRALLGTGVPLLVLAAGLWAGYLYRRGRCRHCWLCPAARKRRRLRNNFQTQCLEAGNLSGCYAGRPAHRRLSQEEDRLVTQSLDEVAGLEDTDAMLDSGPRPVLRPAQPAV